MCNERGYSVFRWCKVKGKCTATGPSKFLWLFFFLFLIRMYQSYIAYILSKIRVYHYWWYLTGNCTAKSLKTSEYSTLLWIWNCKFFLLFVVIFHHMTSLLLSILSVWNDKWSVTVLPNCHGMSGSPLYSQWFPHVYFSPCIFLCMYLNVLYKLGVFGSPTT